MLTLVALLLAFVLIPSPWNWFTVIAAAIVDIAETVAFIWWSKRRRAAVGVETLIGRHAVAASTLAPRGQVRVDGEIWEARSDVSVERGADVVVRAVDGLVLDVEPEPGERD